MSEHAETIRRTLEGANYFTAEQRRDSLAALVAFLVERQRLRDALERIAEDNEHAYLSEPPHPSGPTDLVCPPCVARAALVAVDKEARGGASNQ